MIPDTLATMEYELRRNSLWAPAVAPESTWARIVFFYDGQAVFVSRDLKADALRSSIIQFRFTHRRKRFVARVTLWRYVGTQPALYRTFQLRVPRPYGPVYRVGMADTDFSRIVRIYNARAAAVVVRRLRLPWRTSSPRPSPEVRTGVRYEAWYEFGTQRSYAEIPYTTYQRTYSGTQTPNFGRIKKSKLPINNYGMTTFQVLHCGEYAHNDYHDTAGNLVRDDTFWWPFPVQGGDSEPAFTGGLYDKAVKRLSAASQSDMTSNIAQDLVQIQQTIDLIGNSAGRIAGSLRALRSGNFKGATKALWQNRRAKLRPGVKLSATSSLANNWLELQYGWKPLLQDITGSMEALARYNFADAVARRVASSATSKAKVDTPIKTNDSDPTTIGNFFTDSREVCRLGLRFRLASPLVAFLAQTGFTNPVNLAWELLPFSFVVDWFLPIGPYLETLSQWDGLEFLDGYQTNFLRKRSLGRTYFSGKYKASSEGWHTDRYGLYSSSWIKHTRVRLLSFPGAHLPELRSGLSTTHALNSLALLRVTFGK